MADITRYGEWALEIEGTNYGFEPGSSQVGNQPTTDRIRSGSAMLDDLIVTLRKHPRMQFTLLDPSAYSAWAHITEDGATYGDAFKMAWRQYEENGGWGTGYLSLAFTNGILIPQTLQGDVDTKATLQVEARGLFSSGTAVTVGSSSLTQADVTKAYYPTSLTLGGTSITALRSINVDWQYTVEDDDQEEPTYYYYSEYSKTGQATIKDLSKATAARIADGTEETVVVTFTDIRNDSNTVTIDLGTCKVFGEIQGDMAQISFEELAA